jgi:phosphoenolpyruvate synthase/pyruvate phosphate dikinase
MAVVVQALVRADSSAVVFTRHPVTGRSDVLLIDAVRGLGEAMVSGAVTPHSMVIDKASGSVIDSTTGEAAAGPPLEEAIVAELVALCLEVERAFGAPVDIEAAHAADGWYLLQARPITTAVART